MQGQARFERGFALSPSALNKAFFNRLTKKCTLADFFAESRDILHVEHSNGVSRVLSADTDRGFAFRSAQDDDVIFESSSDIAEIFPRLKNGAVTLKKPSEKYAQKLLNNLEQAFFNKTVLAESLSMRLRKATRRVAVINEKGYFSFNESTITTWDALVTVRKSAKLYEGRVAHSWYGTQNAPGDLLQPLMQALQNAEMQAQAKPIQPGTFNIKFAAAEPAIVFHELLGHALEADYVAQGSSPFSAKLGKIIAHPSVTITERRPPWLKQGDRDDEGTVINKTTLVREGRLINFISDRVSAGRLGIAATGNGRRSSWRNPPMTRMYHTVIESSGRDSGDGLGDYILVDQVDDAHTHVDKGLAFVQVPFARHIQKGKLRALYGPLLLRWNIKDALRAARVGVSGYQDAYAVSDCLKNNQVVPVLCGQPYVIFLNMSVESPQLS